MNYISIFRKEFINKECDVSFTAFLGSVKDLALIGTSITGAVVAIKGLKTWQRQLHGQADYNLARDILIHLFKYRDALNQVRNPAILSHEKPMPPEDKKGGMSKSQISFYGLAEAYKARWEKVSTQKAAIYTSMIESQALWGNDLTELLKNLYKHDFLLQQNIQYHLTLNNPDVEGRGKEFAQKKFRHEVLYDNFSSNDDEFRNNLLSYLEPVELYLKSKLAKNLPENKHISVIKSAILKIMKK